MPAADDVRSSWRRRRRKGGDERLFSEELPRPWTARCRVGGAVLRSALAITFSGASLACGMAGVGLALYGNGPNAWAAAQLFGAMGLVAGLACGCLHAVLAGQPVPEPERLSPEALAQLVRSTLASAKAERQARPGSAADRRPSEVAAAAMAAAANPAPAAEPVPALASGAAVAEAPVGAPAAGSPPGRQFASSAFGV